MTHTTLKYIIGLWLLIFSVNIKAQGYEKNSILINGMYHTQLFSGQTKFEQGFGVNMQYFVTDKLALEYNFSYVSVPNKPDYFKTTGGSLLTGYATVLALNNLSDNAYWLLVIVAAIIPEGVSYHMAIKDNFTISPYINVLSFDVNENYLHYNNSIGLRANMLIGGHLNIAPFAFTQVQYRDQKWGGTRFGFGGGALLGYKF